MIHNIVYIDKCPVFTWKEYVFCYYCIGFINVRSSWLGCVCVCVCMHAVVSNSLQPMDCSPPGTSLSMEFSKLEYWSTLPFPSLRDLSSRHRDRTRSLALTGGFFTSWATREAPSWLVVLFKSDIPLLIFCLLVLLIIEREIKISKYKCIGLFLFAIVSVFLLHEMKHFMLHFEILLLFSH